MRHRSRLSGCHPSCPGRDSPQAAPLLASESKVGSASPLTLSFDSPSCLLSEASADTFEKPWSLPLCQLSPSPRPG